MNRFDKLRNGADNFDDLAGWCRFSALFKNKRYYCNQMMKIERGQKVFPSNAECIRCTHRMYHSSDPLRSGWLRIYGVNKINISYVPIPDVRLSKLHGNSIGIHYSKMHDINVIERHCKKWHVGIHY